MNHHRLYIITLLLTVGTTSYAQTDSALQQIPAKYIRQVDKKIDQYTSRITSKTEKTLTRLARWEAKIKSLLEKASPETAKRLFGNNQLTFVSALEKYKKGEAVIANQRAKYDEYNDKLTTSLGYLEKQKENINAKLIVPIKDAKQKADSLNKQEANTEAMEQFIKERRKQLIDQSVQYIGNSKYLQKISAENYYYVETLKNYKELFQDKKKAEEAALTILNKIPAFTKFIQQNGMLAKLFGAPSTGGNVANLAGLQTRTSVNALIQNQIAAAGPNAQAQIEQNIMDAQNQLSALKDKVMKAGNVSPDADLPIPKNYDATKTKTLLQRIHLGSDIGFVKDINQLPTVANIALTANYQWSSKKEFSIGTAYKAGLGSINHIQFSNQGLGLRGMFSLQMKKSFWATGGWEGNFNTGFKNIAALRDYNAWTQSAMMGVEKRINIKTKFTKSTKFILLYDALAQRAIPARQSFVFRVGYDF